MWRVNFGNKAMKILVLECSQAEQYKISEDNILRSYPCYYKFHVVKNATSIR